MDMTLEFWLDFDSKDRDVLLKVANQAIVKVEREVRGFLIKSQQMLMPQDATVVVWRMVVDTSQEAGIRKSLPYWFRFYANEAGVLPEKSRELLKQENAARAGKAAPPPQGKRTIVIPNIPVKKWWEFWK
ncbi:MAG TPA: hypothetical protein VJ481_00005 [Patescibacteria group bacterium]|nr:hypothetical protein [Patescibacteria group bacterium]